LSWNSTTLSMTSAMLCKVAVATELPDIPRPAYRGGGRHNKVVGNEAKIAACLPGEA
jgi:hypothetical protein